MADDNLLVAIVFAVCGVFMAQIVNTLILASISDGLGASVGGDAVLYGVMIGVGMVTCALFAVALTSFTHILPELRRWYHD